MTDIASFVAKKRKQVKVETVEDKIKKLPWYRRPIERTAFVSRKAKDGNLYVHHCEWTKEVWIGPYKNDKEVLDIINAYVEESLKSPLDRAPRNSIHSVWVEDYNKFFC
jgi:hypothetical protein